MNIKHKSNSKRKLYIKKFIYLSINRLRINKLFEVLTSSRSRILAYHGVSKTLPKLFNWQHIPEDIFIRQMEHIKKYYNVIPIDVLLNDIINKRLIHRKTISLSFDDGYENNFSVAYPILKEMGLPAAIFISTSFIGKNYKSLWFDKLYNAFVQYSANSLNLSMFGIGVIDTSNTENKLKAISFITEQLKLLTTEDRDKLIGNILPIMTQGVPEKFYFPGMSWDQIKILANDPLITIGGHGHTHAILTKLDLTDASKEIFLNKFLIEEHIKRNIFVFAYPNGNWNTDIINILRQAGYKFAMTTKEGFVTSDPFLVNRLTVRNPSTLENFQALTSGVIPLIKSSDRKYLNVE
jgi:peptidoglycan/xylan/chitin deacetylase (PgdA/CDA1 family)